MKETKVDIKQCTGCANYTKAVIDGNCAAIQGGIITVQKMKGWRTKDGICRARKDKSELFKKLK